MQEVEKPIRCPKCGRHTVPLGERKKSKYKSVVFLKAKLARNPGVLSSSRNTVGWLCKSCGYYELSFIPDDYKKYLEEEVY